MSDGLAAAGDDSAAVPALPREDADVIVRQQRDVLTWLGVALILCVVVLMCVGASAVVTGDGNGLNAVRGDAKDITLYILGVLSGVLSPHAVAAVRRKA